MWYNINEINKKEIIFLLNTNNITFNQSINRLYNIRDRKYEFYQTKLDDVGVYPLLNGYKFESDAPDLDNVFEVEKTVEAQADQRDNQQQNKDHQDWYDDQE